MEEHEYGLQELHATMIEMAKFLDEVCRKNNIKYYLKGGSALGAIRHGCFIPWDDDFDVFMLQDDYGEFLRVMSSEAPLYGYHLQLPDSSENPYHFAKLKKDGTLFIEKANEGCDTHPGIFVDVFCLTNLHDNKFISGLQYVCAKLLVAKSLTYKNYKASGVAKVAVLKAVGLIPKALLDRFFKPFVFWRSDSTCRVADFFDRGSFNKCVFGREVIGEPVYVDFCSYKLPVPYMAELYLSVRFGDFMEMPSEEQKVSARHSVRYET